LWGDTKKGRKAQKEKNGRGETIDSMAPVPVKGQRTKKDPQVKSAKSFQRKPEGPSEGKGGEKGWKKTYCLPEEMLRPETGMQGK